MVWSGVTIILIAFEKYDGNVYGNLGILFWGSASELEGQEMGSTSLFGTRDFGRDLKIPFVNIFSLGMATTYNLVQTGNT